LAGMADNSTSKVLLKKRHSLRTQRRLRKREPQIVEGPKSALFLKGKKTCLAVTQVLIDLRQLKFPYAIPYQKKNEIRPFEDVSSLEFYSLKSECSLFCFGSHSKRRPNNLVFGRFFDHQLLDMIEIGFTNYRSISDFPGKKNGLGSPPCFIFKGDKFEDKDDYKMFKSIILDFFHGEDHSLLDLASLDHVIFVTCSSTSDTIYFRHYAIRLKKSGTKLPRVELEEVGPSFDCQIRRVKAAAPDMAKAALAQPKQLHPSKVKNISSNIFGQKLGTIHMHRQDFDKLQIKKGKALKRARSASKEALTSEPDQKRQKVE